MKSVATARKPQAKRARGRRPVRSRAAAVFLLAMALAGIAGAMFQARYTVSLQWPVRVRLQWPLAIARREAGEEAAGARADQLGRRLTAHQQYACNKFGPACRTALAIQRAENPRGACEIYHYNTDGTLDWGYFQINTVHLKRAGLNLRDLLDCRANIDFAYLLYTERGFEPWTTYRNGVYRQFLHEP